MPYTDEELEAVRLQVLQDIQPVHFSSDTWDPVKQERITGFPVTIGTRFWSNDLRVVMITTVARTSNPYQDKATQTWHDTQDGGMFDTLDRSMQPYGRLVRWYGGKNAEDYPSGTNYADVK